MAKWKAHPAELGLELRSIASETDPSEIRSQTVDPPRLPRLGGFFVSTGVRFARRRAFKSEDDLGMDAFVAVQTPVVTRVGNLGLP
jgi:hypothetical protein